MAGSKPLRPSADGSEAYQVSGVRGDDFIIGDIVDEAAWRVLRRASDLCARRGGVSGEKVAAKLAKYSSCVSVTITKVGGTGEGNENGQPSPY